MRYLLPLFCHCALFVSFVFILPTIMVRLLQGLEDLSVEEEETRDSIEDDHVGIFGGEDVTGASNEGEQCANNEELSIDTMEDIFGMDLEAISPLEMRKAHFASLDLAYEFYNLYGRANGFSLRKSKIERSKGGQILQRTFVCHRQGFREDRGLTIENRKREVKPETRCGCQAKFRVHIDAHSQRWRVTIFNDEHNHGPLPGKYNGMLPAHRRMRESDIMQMNNMLKVGIDPPHIYGSFASQSRGYDKIGFRKKDIYNQIARQRRLQQCDAKGALQYLRGLASNDTMMFFRHTSDVGGRLEHLFWCDGISRIDYQVFGDVLAFDATYGKNKYHCPLVVFSGVNNHNHSVIFAGAIVANETEETYVWVLQQFLEAMSGKTPSSVITDGDLAMRNAIKTIFPNAYHRLCAWHLMRNASSNVGNPAFVGKFQNCMLGDYEIGEFRCKWQSLVDEFDLHENRWVIETYEKRKMWATAYIRGNFFAGFRTTSRCEGLHSEIGKFVHSRYNLTDFLLHFHRALNFMRFKEVEADFATDYGELVLQTTFQSLERHASKVFTRELFFMFRDILARSSAMVVNGNCKETCTYRIYLVSKYQVSQRQWRVSFYPSENKFKCSCRRMESFGLPCDHIVAVLVHLHFPKLPKCLVLDRWSKNAKDAICSTSSTHRPNYWDSHFASRYGAYVF